MRAKKLAIFGLWLAVGTQSGHAQGSFGYCQLNTDTHPSTMYFSDPTPVSKGEGNGSWPAGVAFTAYIKAHHPGAHNYMDNQNVCVETDSTLAGAKATLERDIRLRAAESPWQPVVRTGWTYAQTSEDMGTSHGDAPTEAGALYVAEHNAQTPSGKFIKSWSEHTCDKRTKSDAYGNVPKTGNSLYDTSASVFYSCSVKFTYSSENSPTAGTTVGDASTRTGAIGAAKENPARSGELVEEWSTPFCSQTTKSRSNYDKTQVPWWVCEIDYKASR